MQAPFRFARITLFGGLAAGAGLGLLVIIGRLIKSIQGGPGAPPLEVRGPEAGVCLRDAHESSEGWNLYVYL